MPYPEQAAQERYDTWVCQNGSQAQRANVGTKNGSRVRCNDPGTWFQVGGQTTGTPRTGYPGQTEVPGPPLNLPSRADQQANIFNRAIDPKNRKIIVLLIAGFLLFLALTNYE